AIASDATVPDLAERPRASSAGHPDRTLAILDKPADATPGQLDILRELPCLPAGETFGSANPQRSVTGRQEVRDRVGRQLLIGWRPAGDAPDSIEAIETGVRAEPQIAVGRLGDCADRAFRKALADSPRGMRVLADIQRGIQREYTRRHARQDAERETSP